MMGISLGSLKASAGDCFVRSALSGLVHESEYEFHRRARAGLEFSSRAARVFVLSLFSLFSFPFHGSFPSLVFFHILYRRVVALSFPPCLSLVFSTPLSLVLIISLSFS